MNDVFDFLISDAESPYDSRMENPSTPVPYIQHGRSTDQYIRVHQQPQAVNALLPAPPSSAQADIYGYHAPQIPGYWESLETPHSTPRAHNYIVCPNPTYLPFRPDLASQPVNCIEMACDRISPPHLQVSHENKVMGNAGVHNQTFLSPPSCDHTSCYPPADVGYLSRRFPENECWVRGRAAAVASLACRRRGCESL